ncbi:MAG TPA: GNAT family N-acetyltransferase [Solirubrobacteraceae bacterium]|jgi:GNAT superfamily N-acetyltransferase
MPNVAQPTDALTPPGVPAELRDGSRVRIREIRPSDRQLLMAGFERLSPESRYRRFLVPSPDLAGRMARYLTDVDHHDHEAMVALDEQSGDGVGVARYVRDPARPDTAEVAVTVVDDRQGLGLGTLLLDLITARAREEGIRIFTALMLTENREMRDLFDRLGPARTVDQASGSTEIEVPIPAVGVAPELKRLLGIAARNEVAVPPAAGRQAALPQIR